MSLYPRDSTDFIFSPQADAIVDLTRERRWQIPDQVAISAAVVGSFFRRDNNPNQPYTPDEIRRECEACIDAGAAIIHIHVRNEEGWPSTNIDRYRAVMQPLRQQYGHQFVSDACTAFRPWERTQAVIDTRFFELSPVNCTATYVGNTILAFSPAHMQAHTRALMAAGCKPQMSVYNPGDVDTARRFLIEPGIAARPFWWCVLHGLPGCSAPMTDPLAAAETLLLTLRRIRELDPDGFIQVCMAGRPSSYTVAMAMAMGVHSVRVGMEDTIYRWPHRDERIGRNADVVADMVKLAGILGRGVATAADVREWLALPGPAGV